MQQIINLSKIFAIIFVFATAIFAQNAKISGTVTYGGENTVLHDVRVEIIQLKKTVKTDANGKYVFENVSAGRYTILVHNDGFADLSKTIDVTADETVALDFQLEISSVKEEVTVTASGSGS